MRTFKKYLYDSWWVALFFLLCAVFYEEGLRKKNSDLQALTKEYNQLLQLKESEAVTHQSLELQVSSQSDPAWVELVLMKELGVVPEEQKKVVFTWK